MADNNRENPFSGEVRQGIPMPGFSGRVNHPEIVAAVKKNNTNP